MQRNNDEKYMRKAIEKARAGIASGQTPFGCCIVRDDTVIALTHNTVWRDTDSTAHAEIKAIQQACAEVQAIDLSGCVLYTTCEPCPMCFSAGHWARVSRIVFAARIADAQAAGFNELAINAERMRELGKSSLSITADVLRGEAVKLFAEWSARKGSRAY